MAEIHDRSSWRLIIFSRPDRRSISAVHFDRDPRPNHVPTDPTSKLDGGELAASSIEGNRRTCHGVSVSLNSREPNSRACTYASAVRPRHDITCRRRNWLTSGILQFAGARINNTPVQTHSLVIHQSLIISNHVHGPREE